MAKKAPVVFHGVNKLARKRGVTPAAVRKAARTGRIPVDKDGNIDSEAAMRAWDENTDTTKPRNSVTGDPKGDGSGPPNGDSSHKQYAKNRAAREGYLALMAKLDYEKASGKIVDVDEVRVDSFKVARRVRERFLALSDRLAAVVAGLTDPADCHKVIDDEVQLALSELHTEHAQSKS